MNAKFVDGTTENVKIAVGTSGNVFVGVENNGQPSGTDLVGLFASQDGGLTWTAYTLPTTTEACPATFGINPGGQGELHFSIVADPNSPKVVYVAGDRQPARNEVPPAGSCAGAQFPNSLGANNYTGRIFRVSDTGATAETDSGTASGTGPHADSRAMVFDASGNILEGDDGGIYKRSSPINATGDWTSIVGNLQISEMHDVAYDSISAILFGGDQDTGIPSQNATNGLPWTDLQQGDGGDVGVDTISAAPNSLRYISSTNFSGFQQRTFTPGNAQVGMPTFPALTLNAGSPAATVQFYTPVKVNRITPTRLLFGFGNDVYESLNQGGTITSIDLGHVPPAPGVTVNDGTGHLALIYGGTTGGGYECGSDLRRVGRYRLSAHGSTGNGAGGDRRLARGSQHQ